MPDFDPVSQLSILREISGQLAAGPSLEDVLATVTNVLVERVGVRAVAIWLCLTDAECEHCREIPGVRGADERRLHRVVRSTNPAVNAFGDVHALPVDEAFAEQVRRDRAPFWYNTPLELGELVWRGTGGRADIPPAEELAESMRKDGVQAGALFPLMVGDDLTGFLTLLADRPLAAEEIQYLEVFAIQAASIIRSARLYVEVERLRDHLALENAYLEEAVREEAGFAEIVGTSPVLEDVIRLVRQVAPTDSTVLLSGRDRDREGAGRAGHPRREPPGEPSADQGELRRSRAGPGGERAVRARAGSVHRRDPAADRAVRAGRPGDAVPGRGGGAAAGDQVKLLRVLQEREFERVGGDAHAAGGRAGHRGDPPRSRPGGRRRAVPRGPLLPAQRVPDPDPAAAGAAGGHRAAGAALRARSSPAGWAGRSRGSRAAASPV